MDPHFEADLMMAATLFGTAASLQTLHLVRAPVRQVVVKLGQLLKPSARVTLVRCITVVALPILTHFFSARPEPAEASAVPRVIEGATEVAGRPTR